MWQKGKIWLHRKQRTTYWAFCPHSSRLISSDMFLFRTKGSNLITLTNTHISPANRYIWACRCGEDGLLRFKAMSEWGKKSVKVPWWSVPDWLQAVSLTAADQLGFSRTAIGICREWSEQEKISSKQQLCGEKCLVDVIGERTDWSGTMQRWAHIFLFSPLG